VTFHLILWVWAKLLLLKVWSWNQQFLYYLEGYKTHPSSTWARICISTRSVGDL
jgi:hypothetical protein